MAGLLIGLTVGAVIMFVAWTLSELGIVTDWQRRRRQRRAHRAKPLPPATAPQIARAARANRAELRVVKRGDDDGGN